MKTYTISDKEFVLTKTWKAYELLDDLLRSVGSGMQVKDDGSNVVVEIANMLNALVRERFVPKALSYMLTERGQQWTESGALANEAVLGYISDEQLVEVLRDFFPGKMRLFVGLMPYFGISIAPNAAQMTSSSDAATGTTSTLPN
jgi:hypothetical protein